MIVSHSARFLDNERYKGANNRTVRAYIVGRLSTRYFRKHLFLLFGVGNLSDNVRGRIIYFLNEKTDTIRPKYHHQFAEKRMRDTAYLRKDVPVMLE